MLKLVASGQAVSAIPDCLVQNVPGVSTLRIGEGIAKSINLGLREKERPDFFDGFVGLSQNMNFQVE